MKALSRWFARAGATLTLLGVAAAMGVLAVVFLSLALYFALVAPLGAPLAALVTGGVLLAVAGIVVLVAWLMISPPRRQPAKSGEPDGRAAAARLGEMLGEETGNWTKRHPGSAMLAALAAGFAVGSSPKLRDLVWRLLR